jgi:hypothetical protein
VPQAVAPWTWRRMLREHGPDDPGFLLAMLMLGTYMDQQGFAYPGQQAWAKAARKSVRMLQRYIARGRREGWINVVNAGRSGHGWRFNGYRCCVPDYVDLGELDQTLADSVQSQAGDIEPHDTMMSSPPANGHDTAMSPAYPLRVERDDTADRNVTTSDAQGDDTTRQNVTTQSCRTKSALKVSSRTPALEGALRAPPVKRFPETGEPEDPENRRAKILALRDCEPGDVAKLLRASGVTVEEVLQVRGEARA